MVYAVNLGSRVHNWNDAQVRRNLELLANYRVYRYPTHKMSLLSHIFRAIALPFYSLRFNYTFGNNYHANNVLIQLRPMVCHDYKLALLFNRLAPFYHLDCVELPPAPVVVLPQATPYIPTTTVYNTPVLHVPAPILPPSRSFFSRIAPAFNFGGGRQIPGTEAVDLNTRHRGHVTPTAVPPLASRHVTYAPTESRQLPGSDRTHHHARPAKTMVPFASPTPTRTQTPYADTNVISSRVAVGGGRRR